jgi:bifunctional non-homologous end joining protein LigD
MAADRGGRELQRYRAKRDFARTPEPAPDRATEPAPDRAADRVSASAQTKRRGRSKQATSKAQSMRFVVHEHHARRLHWDLRLERDGALMSWAVPNGIPQDPRENRKAIHVEDHPLSYIDFEGEIPEGSYGAGRVLIWDRGSYDCEKFSEDKLVVVFHGQQLQGRYALFRTHDEEQDWMIHRMDPPLHEREIMPEHLRPMLASSGELPRAGKSWAFEVKWDGIRALTYWRPGRLRIESRNLNDITSRYPELRPLGRELGAREAILDGEIVAFDQHGTPSFERLQQRMHITSEGAIRRLSRDTPVTYAIFDLLHLDGRSTMGLPYRERRALLEQLGLNGPAWSIPAAHRGSGRDLLHATAEHGLEGIIAKRLDSPYQPGERGPHWVKIKNVNRQELVIGGWLPGKGRRAGALGALLMGYYEGEEVAGEEGRGEGKGKGKDESDGTGDTRELRYAGRVGTGFDDDELLVLDRELAKRARRSSPFARRGTQPPRDARFVEPQLVAEIEFSHWTKARILRHSSYKGLRSDKPAHEVQLEAPTAPSAGAPDGSAAKRPATRKPAARAEPSDTPPSPSGRPTHAPQGASLKTPSSSSQPYEVLHETKRYTEVAAQGRTLRLSNRDKVLFPATGFTKGHMIDYYAAVAPLLVPHLAGRALTFKRYPDGVQAQHFYEKRCPGHRPEWVQTAPIWSERLKDPIDYCLVDDLPSLIWVANLASIELHPSLSLARAIDTPTALVFDLDPGAPAGLRECCRVALLIREMFDALGLTVLVKTSGSKGMQVYLPLNTPISYEQTKPFARAVAQLLEKQHPQLVLSRMTKSLRPGKVLIDWSQNDPHKTTVSVYSLRALERPTISTPLTWEEVEQGTRRRKEPQLSTEPHALLRRIERHGDLFAPLLRLTQTLPELAGPPAAGKRARKIGSARSEDTAAGKDDRSGKPGRREAGGGGPKRAARRAKR